VGLVSHPLEGLVGNVPVVLVVYVHPPDLRAGRLALKEKGFRYSVFLSLPYTDTV
jgi:hypothetical protein